MKKYLFIFIKLGVLAAVLIFGFIKMSDYWIIQTTEKLSFNTIENIPTNDVAVILGTTPNTKSGYQNPYFKYRIDAAVDLYKSGKVKHLLVSGDNSFVNYNEPRYMFEALVERGIPMEAITLDFAGFRTLDSVVRAKEVFQQAKFTIISQKFHNERALFIARHRGIDAIAYNAKTPSFHSSSIIKYREYLARAKAIFDIYILNKEPKFLGNKEVIKV